MRGLSQLLRHVESSEMDDEGWMSLIDVARLLNTTIYEVMKCLRKTIKRDSRCQLEK